VTIEDPVEYRHIERRCLISQREVGQDTESFRTALKMVLRQDPDVILIGEMRDAETVWAAISAAETGHLVFATLHTNSAPESIVRLLDMGMDPFNFSDALLGVLAQRLAKRLCSKCKQPHVASQDEIKLLLEEYCTELKNTDTWKKDPKAAFENIYREWAKTFADDKGQFTLYTPVGCEVCGGTGYKGRVGLHELLLGSDLIKKLIQEHARVAEILAAALNDGMRTLKQDGMEKVLQGVTDMHQVRAVCIK
jgi:type II secretory ATPase GspE/PulE/Tfp pilus assembly ATPase PilB-like protein